MNVLCPGAVETPTNVSVVEGGAGLEKMRRRISLWRVGSLNEIADVVALLFGEGAKYMYGSVVEVSGGLQWEKKNFEHRNWRLG